MTNVFTPAIYLATYYGFYQEETLCIVRSASRGKTCSEVVMDFHSNKINKSSYVGFNRVSLVLNKADVFVYYEGEDGQESPSLSLRNQ